MPPSDSDRPELPLFAAHQEAPPKPARPVFSVAQLGRRLKGLLERSTEGVLVGGEVTGLKEHASGHAYFTLRDENEEAAIDCVMYRSASPRARSLLAEGARLIVRGRVTFWPPRGRVQLVVDGAKPAGRGALLLALENLKKKLLAEGLFARERKRALPTQPRVVGVVTSASGAVLSDIVKVADRRGAVRIVVAPASVQGEGAARSILRALVNLEKHPEVEVIILARGGGSVDDLQVFNEEALVRKVFACRVPVVSAVGHETDVTLVDLVADVRAATPSQAAELVVFDQRARERDLALWQRRLVRAIVGSLDERRQRMDVARADLIRSGTLRISRERERVARLERRLKERHPATVLAAARRVLASSEAKLLRIAQGLTAGRRRRLVRDAARLEAMSPLAVLRRGYALVSRDGGELVRDASTVSRGEPLSVRVATGRFQVVVAEAPPKSDPQD